MIKRIIKIKNCPSFIDFKPASDLPEFTKYNLIYGWNGSGKTCFSRVLRSFEVGENYYEHPERQGEFEFELDNGTSINHKDLVAFKNIRVFNKDFVDESVFGISGPKPIFFLGKESKEYKEKIIKIEDELEKLRKKIGYEKPALEKAKSIKGKKLQDKARDIKNALTTTKQDKYRNYDRIKFEEAIRDNARKLKSSENLKLSDERLVILIKSIQQTSKPEINNLSLPSFDLSEFEIKVQDILSKKVTSQIIEKLLTDQDLNKWVEKGLQIHREKSLDVCAFCDQKIPQKRFDALENHFNNEYRGIMQTLKELKQKGHLRKLKGSFPESSDFYEDLVEEYLKNRNNAKEAIESFNKRVDSILILLEQKELNPFIKLSLEEKTFALDSFEKINKIIKRHNKKTEDFENQIDKNKEELEDHYISEFYPSYCENIEEINTLEGSCLALEKSIKDKEDEIKNIKENLVTYYIPAKQINKDLEQFLGRDDIQLKATEIKEGYTITRNREIAKDLSEGEKTALAIVYFLTKISEEGFDLKNSVVVIDDPVSSLDSNSIFQAFSFIKESVKNAGQVFILTHHFDFFRQVKNWFSYKGKGEYFMVVCKAEQPCRNSSIIKLDKLLKEYESEYHFLFSVLYKYAKNNEYQLEKIYPLPNIARKFLESFLAFRVPVLSQKQNPKEPQICQRLECIKDFDEKKKERIRRFVETHSHPRYENGVQDFDMTILGETPDILKDLIDLVKTEDEKHYKYLVESIKVQNASLDL
jgi:wobble nucleotide-excising tRNase